MNVLIIGASRGIGLELVRQYRADGSAVCGTARDDAGLARIEALGASAVKLDVTAAAVCKPPPSHTPLDLVIYNAGVNGARGSDATSPSQAEFDRLMHTNVWGAMQQLPQLQPVLAPNSRVVVVSSKMGSMGARTAAGSSLYRASKAALNSVLKDLSLALAGKAVCVSFHPGWVQTDMGGTGADIDVATSVKGMRAKISTLRAPDNGGFFNYDGTPLPW
jgi:NAD(P)-dependent dehydrogenase (short-subunit alcohol dehydrogenase family)